MSVFRIRGHITTKNILFQREKTVRANSGEPDTPPPTWLQHRDLLQLIGEDRRNLVLREYPFVYRAQQ